MFQSKPKDEPDEFIRLLLGELTLYSEQCPRLKQYVFSVADDQWIAEPKHPISFDAGDNYYLRNFRKLLAYIRSNFSQEISEQFAADKVGLSVSEFCRFFRKQTGATFVS